LGARKQASDGRHSASLSQRATHTVWSNVGGA
jgi:hypothetical protein